MKCQNFFRKDYNKNFLLSHIIIFLIICLFILLSDFHYCFIIVATMITLIYGIYNSFNISVCIILFLYSFDSAFIIKELNGLDVFNILMALLICINGLKYIIDISKKKNKIEWKCLFLCIAIIIYMLLPIFPFEFTNSIKYIIILIGIYLAYVYKDKLSFHSFVYFSGFGIIISSLYALLLSPNGRILCNISLYFEGEFQKFNGLFWNPNCLSIYAIIIMSCLAILIINENKLIDYMLFFGIFVFGYNTISRNFILCLGVILLSMIVVGFVKLRKKFFFSAIFVSVTILIFILCMFSQTTLYISRFIHSPEIQLESSFDMGTDTNDLEGGILYLSDESDTMIIINEDQYEDPGRLGLWKKYLEDIISSWKVLLFGKGISAKWLGMVPAHNGFIQLIWNWGITGTIMLMILFITIFRQNKINYKLIIPISAFLIMSLFENTIFNIWTFILILFITSLNGGKKHDK